MLPIYRVRSDVLHRDLEQPDVVDRWPATTTRMRPRHERRVDQGAKEGLVEVPKLGWTTPEALCLSHCAVGCLEMFADRERAIEPASRQAAIRRGSLPANGAAIRIPVARLARHASKLIDDEPVALPGEPTGEFPPFEVDGRPDFAITDSPRAQREMAPKLGPGSRASRTRAHARSVAKR